MECGYIAVSLLPKCRQANYTIWHDDADEMDSNLAVIEVSCVAEYTRNCERRTIMYGASSLQPVI